MSSILVVEPSTGPEWPGLGCQDLVPPGPVAEASTLSARVAEPDVSPGESQVMVGNKSTEECTGGLVVYTSPDGLIY